MQSRRRSSAVIRYRSTTAAVTARTVLLLSHVDIDDEDLRAQAAKYGLDNEIDALVQSLKTHGEIQDSRLFEW